MLDVIIRNGDVIDGTGTPRRRADVGISEGRIEVIGDLSTASAPREIDATGTVVIPGFVDVHTHYDAQAFWDGALTPSPLHGVTSVFAGNCGFSIAPLSHDPEDGAYLMRMLARVEGMPLESLEKGVPWDWTTTAEFLDAVEGRLGINAGFMVGHSALRRVAMGGDANQRSATPDEVAAMARLLRDGLEAGGMGFSSSWARTHNDMDRQTVPSRHATREEIIELCAAVRDYEGTSLEFIPMIGPSFEPWASELMADMSVAADRTLNWNVLLVSSAQAATLEDKLAASDVAASHGGRVIALTMPQSFGLRLSFGSGFVLDAIPGWEETMLLPQADRLAAFRSEARRRELGDLAASPKNMVANETNWAKQTVFTVATPENEQYVGRLIGDIAAEQRRSPWETICDIALADELRTSFGMVVPRGTEDDWKLRSQVWRDDRVLIGASDAGAHLDMFGTFNYTTVLLAEAVRARGLLTLEQAVYLLTDRPARMYGLVNRGRLQEGWSADIVVLDPERVDSDELEMRFDLPGGAGRLYADSSGIEHVLVNGVAIVSEGALTSARPGRVLRSGRDTRTTN
jgi:N-acyl-D-aspartate/D-glutamate deacylase